MKQIWPSLSLLLALAGLPPGAEAPEKSPDEFLAFDGDTQEATVQAGEAAARFTFSVANISDAPVTIKAATASCGCTVAKLPAQPWTLAPGAHGEISITMNVAGKSGEVTKFVYVNTTAGTKMLTVKTTIRPSPEAAREANRKIAATDRQAVFKGDCARCHVEPVGSKMRGETLYAAACATCHESEHRATMVPDLRALARTTGPEFWRNAIAHGKPDSLMPAFASGDGGFLSEAQITSLVAYLSATTPTRAGQ